MSKRYITCRIVRLVEFYRGIIKDEGKKKKKERKQREETLKPWKATGKANVHQCRSPIVVAHY